MPEILGNHPPGWEPTAADVPREAPGGGVVELSSAERAAVEDLQEIGKVEGLRQSQADMTSAFGPPIEEGNQVRWSIDMRDPRNRGMYKELSAPHRRAMTERSKKWNARKKVELTNRTTGEKRLVFEEFEDVIGRRNGMIRRQLGGLQIERGPDGMLFRLVAKEWQPTGRTCIGTPLDPNDDGVARGLQRDPDGVAWVEVDGDWEQAAALFNRKTKG